MYSAAKRPMMLMKLYFKPTSRLVLKPHQLIVGTKILAFAWWEFAWTGLVCQGLAALAVLAPLIDVACLSIIAKANASDIQLRMQPHNLLNVI